MKTIGERIKFVRKKKPMTQSFLADLLGVDRRTIINWESNETEPSREMIERLADVLGTSKDYIMYGTNNIKKIPVFGKVAAGIPLEAIEEVLDYEEIPAHWGNASEYFALKVFGDSMQPRMYENDVVIVRKQSDVDNGDIAIVLVNGADATIKKILKTLEGITLQPLNFNYSPVFYSKKDIERLPVIILGKVVELRAKY